MRTISAGDEAALTGVGRSERVKVEIYDGSAWRDLSSYPGYNAVDGVSWGESVDDPHMTAQVTLRAEHDGFSLAPLMAASAPNVGFTPGGSYAPLIALNRELKVSVSLDGGVSYTLVFHGRVDDWEHASGTLTLNCRDLGGALADRWIETERAYGMAPVGVRIWAPGLAFTTSDYVVPSDGKRAATPRYYQCTTAGTTGATEPTWPTSGTVASGTAVFTHVGTLTTSQALEDVIQDILTDNDTGVTLYAPDDPDFEITPYLQQRESVLEAVRTLAFARGWDLRYKWRSGTAQFELTLVEPDRAASSPVRTFGASEYAQIDGLRIEKSGIRNVVRVVYSDTADLDASGTAKRKWYEATDSTSVSEFGRLFMEIAEDSSSPINTATEAQRMAEGAVSDLATPRVEQRLSLVHGFPFVELGDLYRFTPNQRHYSANQDLAVVDHRHEARDGFVRTSLGCRGKPSAGFDRWHRISGRAQPSDVHRTSVFQSRLGPTLTTFPVVGGVNLSLNQLPVTTALPEVYQWHVSPTSGFTPSSSTLQTVTASRQVSVANLLPGETYYATAVPLMFNDTRPVLGAPSTEVSFEAGRGEAGHLSSLVDWGRQPLNGGFETVFVDPVTSQTRPQHWTVVSGAFGSNMFVDSGVSGGSGLRTLRIVKSASAGDVADLESGRFVVVPGDRLALRTRGNPVSGAGQVSVGIRFYDSGGAFISQAQPQAWPGFVPGWNTQTDYVAVPSTAASAAVFLRASGAAAVTCYIDDVSALVQPPIAICTHSAGQSLATGTSVVINYANVTVDSHGAVTTGGAWNFTAPTAGKYLVTASITLVESGASHQILMNVRRNGASIHRLGNAMYPGVAGNYELCGSAVVVCAAGDQLEIIGFHSAGANRSLEASAIANHVSIQWVSG